MIYNNKKLFISRLLIFSIYASCPKGTDPRNDDTYENYFVSMLCFNRN